MTSTLPAEALEGDIMVLGGAMAALEEVTVDMEVLEEVTEDLGGVMEVLGEATVALEWGTEDLEVLDPRHMVLECIPMALEEDMVELGHTLMVAQALYMVCQDLEGRGDIMHRLQLMVGSLLLTAPNLLSMAPNLQFMMLNLQLMALNLLLLNPLPPTVQGLLMMQLLRPMHPLPTVFLLAMVVNLLRSSSSLELSSSLGVSNSSLVASNCLEPSNNLRHRHLLLL